MIKQPSKTAMVFAAGMGTRLKPLTDTMPKALIEVGGKPLLEHVLLKLCNAGFNRVVINVHHFSEQIIAYLNEHSFDMDILISDESRELLETGGGIKFAEHLIGHDAPFLVHNVDILSNLDFEKFYLSHRKNSLATLLVSNRTTCRYLLFDHGMRLVGWTNVDTGEVKSPYKNLNVNACQKLAFAGIHVISPRVFELMNLWHGKFSIIDFYLSVADKEPIYGFNDTHLELIDVGKLDTLAVADTFIKKEHIQ